MSMLSIIISSHNRSSLLGKTLHSLSLQSNMNFKVIFVDHGSTDNTNDIILQYQKKMNIEYHWLLRTENDPATPKDFGAKLAKTPIIAFLDCGLIVPPSYAQAHMNFHAGNNNCIGLGMYHAHHPDRAISDQWIHMLDKMSIDEAGALLVKNEHLRDERTKIRISHLELPWLYGWGANLSMSIENYKIAGGLDPKQKYGIEDLDICYRLFKQGFTFAFVEDGWGIDLPHDRAPLQNVIQMRYQGWQRSYEIHKSLALEVARYTELIPPKAEKAFRYLQQLGNDYADLAAPSPEMRRSFTRPSLLVGATIQDAPDYDYIALSQETVRSTNTIWSCCGILIPLSDHALETVVVTDMWKWLGVSFQVKGLSLLESLIAEIKRTAHVAYFMDSSQLPDRPEREIVSQDILVELCQKYDLPFQFLVAESLI